jgi:nucleotide-binding universal stress UspA family protein
MAIATGKHQQKILWALDPFEGKSPARSHLLGTLEDLSRRGARIEPVYVLGPDVYGVDTEFAAPWPKEIRPNAIKALDRYVGKLKPRKISGMGKPKLILERRPSLTQAVLTLTSYAKKSHADAIIVSTHARGGLVRFFVGSFAETLLLYSKVPVLVIGPKSKEFKATQKKRRILFATDFGTASFYAFKKVLEVAKNYSKEGRGKITLFHCLPHPVEPLIQSGVYLLGGGSVTFPDLQTKEELRRRKAAEKYVAAAKKQGVDVEIEWNSGLGSFAHAITDQAKKDHVDLIAMAADSGAIKAALVGSVTRQVVRSAPCPVWVLRIPQSKSA